MILAIFKDVGSDATSGSGFEQFKRWTHTYEGGKKEGKFYIVQPDGGRRKWCWHGVDIGTHGAELRKLGYSTEIGSKIPIDVVDAIEEREINGDISAVKLKLKIWIWLNIKYSISK